MNVSTNLPTSLRAYDALPGTAPSKLKSNVSAAADAAFIAELRSKEPERYRRLEKAMLTECIRQRAEVGTELGRPKQYASAADRQRAYRERKAATASEPFSRAGSSS